MDPEEIRIRFDDAEEPSGWTPDEGFSGPYAEGARQLADAQDSEEIRVAGETLHATPSDEDPMGALAAILGASDGQGWTLEEAPNSVLMPILAATVGVL